jgi:hypothetical protein
MAAMGGRFTNLLRWLGVILYFFYRVEFKIKGKLRKKSDPDYLDILNRAKVAGAIDWIAYRPE